MPKSGDSDRSIVCFGLVCFANVGIVGLCLIAINSIVLLPYWLSRDASVLFIPYGLGCTIINYSVRSVRHDQITTMYREERMCKYIFNVKFRLENTTNDKVASWKSRSWTKPNNFNLNCSVDDNNATVMFSPKPNFRSPKMWVAGLLCPHKSWHCQRESCTSAPIRTATSCLIQVKKLKRCLIRKDFRYFF